MSDVYRDLLLLCDFNENEINEYRVDLKLIAEKFCVKEADFKISVEKMQKYFDTEFLGIRKLFGAIVREILDISKSYSYKENGYSMIYSIVPVPISLLLSVKNRLKEKVYIGTPDIFFTIIKSIFFKKGYSLTDDLNVKCRHCMLNVVRTLYSKYNYIPKPDLMISCSTICDEASKTDEFINCFYDFNWNYNILKIPHDTFDGYLFDNSDRVELFRKEIDDIISEIQTITNISLTSEDLKYGVDEWKRFFLKIQYLNMLVNSDPQPIGGNELSLISTTMLMFFNTGMKYVEEAIDVLIKEVREKIKKGKGILPKGSPRVGCNYVPFCSPWIDREFKKNGVCLGFSTILSMFDLKFSASDNKDVLDYITKQWLSLPMINGLFYEAEAVCKIIQKFKPNGMIFGNFDFDRWMGMHSKLMLQIICERTGISSYYMEGDFWNEKKSQTSIMKIENICSVLKTNLNIKR